GGRAVDLTRVAILRRVDARPTGDAKPSGFKFMKLSTPVLGVVGILLWQGCGKKESTTARLMPDKANASETAKSNNLFSMPAPPAAITDIKWLADRKQEQIKAAQTLAA